jgi:hypothetical protein
VAAHRPGVGCAGSGVGPPGSRRRHYAGQSARSAVAGGAARQVSRGRGDCAPQPPSKPLLGNRPPPHPPLRGRS